MFDALALKAVVAYNIVAAPPTPAPKPSLPPLPDGPDYSKVQFVSDPFTLTISIVLAIITMVGIAVLLFAGIPWMATKDNENAARHLEWLKRGAIGAVGGFFFHFLFTGSFNLLAGILA